ncbi:MAG: hypothetical protein GY702_27750 [Desulfobulbaceae bacterium]|nr:hypothetical protein [Desulfobulbaceae bacterium]
MDQQKVGFQSDDGVNDRLECIDSKIGAWTTEATKCREGNVEMSKNLETLGANLVSQLQKLEESWKQYRRGGYQNRRRGGRQGGQSGSQRGGGGHNQTTEQETETRVCFGCGTQGHLVKSCPQRVHTFCSKECFVDTVSDGECAGCDKAPVDQGSG